jgi:hypothetical protein
MARAVEQHKAKPAKRTSRRRTRRQSGRGSQNNPSKTEPSRWLAVEDVFQRWRDRLGSSQEAVDELEGLLRNRETCSAIQHTSASGEITHDILHAQFWRDVARLEVDTDADGVDRVRVEYPVYVHTDYSLFGGSTEFLVRAVDDVQRWERLHPELAPPPPSKAPTAVEKGAARAKPRKPKQPRMYKRYAGDEALVAEAIKGLKKQEYPNVWQAALALAPRAQGSDHGHGHGDQPPAKVFRLNKKIGNAYKNLKTPQNISKQIK